MSGPTDGFEFTVDWGDGNSDTVNGDPDVTASHAYDAVGSSPGTVMVGGQTFTSSQVMVYGGGGNDRMVVQGTAGTDSFGINPEAVAFNGVAFQGTAVENWPADGLSGNDTFYINGPGLAIGLKGGDGNDTFKVTAVGAVNGRVDGGAGPARAIRRESTT